MVKNYLEIIQEDLKKAYSENEKMFETIKDASGFAKRQVLYSVMSKKFSYYQNRLAVSILRKQIEPTVNRYEIDQAMKVYDRQIEKIDNIINTSLLNAGVLTDRQIAGIRRIACRNADRDLYKIASKTASQMISLEAKKFVPTYGRRW